MPAVHHGIVMKRPCDRGMITGDYILSGEMAVGGPWQARVWLQKTPEMWGTNKVSFGYEII